MINPPEKPAAKSKITQLLTSKQMFSVHACLIFWGLVELIFLSIPDLINYLSFFDAFTFPGVHVRSQCTSGDPTTNARLLMCAWTISFALTVYTTIKFLKDENFYPEFVARADIVMASEFMGRNSAPRIKYYCYLFVVSGIAYGYYIYMLAGHGDRCSKFLVDRALLGQGAAIIATGYFAAVLGVLSYRKIKSRTEPSEEKKQP